MLVGSCQQAMASGIYNPGSTGAGGSGGYALQPATVTIVAAQGVTLPDNTTVSTGAINLSQMANLANANAVINGNFDSWLNTTSVTTPNSGTYVASLWRTFYSASIGTIAFNRSAATVKNAQYSFQVNQTGTLGHPIVAIEQPITNYYAYAGSSVTLTAWVYSSSATTITILDSVGASTSTAHPGDTAWHQLSVTRFLSAGITLLTVRLGTEAMGPSDNGTSRYYDGVMLVTGDTPITYFPQPWSTTVSDVQTDPVQGIIGVVNGTSASAGTVGEYIESVVSAVASPAASTVGDITSISLTAGDWDVSGLAYYTNYTGGTQWQLGITSSVGASNTGRVLGSNWLVLSQASTSGDISMNVPVVRVNLSATTTYYLKTFISYTGGSPTGSGRLSARRVR